MSTGTTYLRKDGRWETRVSLGVIDGKRQTKSFYGRTKEEAEGKMMAEVMNGMSFQITRLTVKALCMEWLSVNSHRVKVSTQANYMTKLEKHILPYFGDTMCCEVSSKMVYGFIQAKLDEGLSAGYVSNILVLLKTVFKYAQKEYRILNPFDNVIMPKGTKSETHLLTKKEQKKLKEYLKSNVNTAMLGISLAISMGLRIGEICGLTWQDIDFKSRTLTVRRTVQRIRVKGEAKKTKIVILPPKSKSSFREIPIPTSVFSMLKDLRSTPEHYILSDTTEPKEPRMMYYDYVEILKELGLHSFHGCHDILPVHTAVQVSATHFRKRSHRSPFVQLKPPADRNHRPCLQEIRRTLLSLSIPAGSWSMVPPAQTYSAVPYARKTSPCKYSCRTASESA